MLIILSQLTISAITRMTILNSTFRLKEGENTKYKPQKYSVISNFVHKKVTGLRYKLIQKFPTNSRTSIASICSDAFSFSIFLQFLIFFYFKIKYIYLIYEKKGKGCAF